MVQVFNSKRAPGKKAKRIKKKKGAENPAQT